MDSKATTGPPLVRAVRGRFEARKEEREFLLRERTIKFAAYEPRQVLRHVWFSHAKETAENARNARRRRHPGRIIRSRSRPAVTHLRQSANVLSARRFEFERQYRLCLEHILH